MKYTDSKKNKGKANTEPQDILTEPELAEYLGVSVWTVKRLRQNEGLPVLRFKKVRSILYYRPAVDDWLRSLSAPAADSATEEGKADAAGENKPSKLEQVITKGKKGRFAPMEQIPD
ncbi:MAG: helix-turn-helix domain-containing protein [Acidaminococcaceae bacterium]|nr:helix-turn-helix domain-containing protein [Acidaminococcaceae bacterium]